MKKRSFTVVAAGLVLAAGLTFGSRLAAGEAAAKPPTVASGQQAISSDQPQQIVISPVEAFTIMAGEAEKGSPRAMLTLGTFYEQGIGTPRNFVKALEWYEKAAAAGSAEAFYRVGVAYEIGLGNTGDPQKSFESFEKSAEMNLPEGFYKLATLYITGSAVQKNEAWGVALLTRAADMGHMNAANDLGVIFFEGLYGNTRDVSKAYDMFIRSADLGNAEAMKNLGVFYREGIGRPADPAQELKWYTLALRAGFRQDAMVVAIKELRDKIGPDAAKKVDAEVEAWVAAFQAREKAKQEQAQAQAKVEATQGAALKK